MYYVYVLKSAKDNRLYYGYTASLEQRVNQHNQGKVKSTNYRRPLKLSYYEKVGTLDQARKKEKYFKSGFGRKYIKHKIETSHLS